MQFNTYIWCDLFAKKGLILGLKTVVKERKSEIVKNKL